MKTALLSIGLLALAAAIPAWAHHSFAAYYDEQQNIKVEGKVTAFLYRSPHSFVELESTDENGVTTRWAAEWFSSSRLTRVGIVQDTFKPGDHVIITGAPGRAAGDHRVHLKTIVRPSDGFKFDQMARGGRYR